MLKTDHRLEAEALGMRGHIAFVQAVVIFTMLALLGGSTRAQIIVGEENFDFDTTRTGADPHWYSLNGFQTGRNLEPWGSLGGTRIGIRDLPSIFHSSPGYINGRPDATGGRLTRPGLSIIRQVSGTGHQEVVVMSFLLTTRANGNGTDFCFGLGDSNLVAWPVGVCIENVNNSGSGHNPGNPHIEIIGPGGVIQRGPTRAQAPTHLVVIVAQFGAGADSIMVFLDPPTAMAASGGGVAALGTPDVVETGDHLNQLSGFSIGFQNGTDMDTLRVIYGSGTDAEKVTAALRGTTRCYPGTGHPFALESIINGVATPSTSGKVAASPGDLVTIATSSLDPSMTGLGFLLGANIIAQTTEPLPLFVGGYPSVWLDLSTLFILLDGISAPSPFSPTLHPGGFGFGPLLIPAALLSSSLVFQSFADIAGTFASTAGLRVDVL